MRNEGVVPLKQRLTADSHPLGETSMNLDVNVVGLYVGMVLFGFFAYAYIIPYFTVRKFRKMLESGEGARMILELLHSKIEVPDPANPKETHEVTIAQFLVSVAITNLKMQLNSVKSSLVRGFLSGDGGEEGGTPFLDAVPKKMRWVVQLFGPMVAQVVQERQAKAATGAAITGAAMPHY